MSYFDKFPLMAYDVKGDKNYKLLLIYSDE